MNLPFRILYCVANYISCLFHVVIVCSDGGYFNAIMLFPPTYPLSPPSVRFISEMWHPNGDCMLTSELLKILWLLLFLA